jgi:hypothetical protein
LALTDNCLVAIIEEADYFTKKAAPSLQAGVFWGISLAVYEIHTRRSSHETKHKQELGGFWPPDRAFGDYRFRGDNRVWPGGVR